MSALPHVLDACCGGRMFWFDRQNPDALFIDKRRETHVLTDTTRAPGSRVLSVAPDVLADFTALPFPEASFSLVVFDPPHLTIDRPDADQTYTVFNINAQPQTEYSRQWWYRDRPRRAARQLSRLDHIIP